MIWAITALMGFNSKSLLFTACVISLLLSSFALDVSYDNRSITINGDRKIILSGSIHYPRSTPEMWSSLMKKAKEGGLNTIETYVFWNAHEPLYRQYDFSGNLDLIRFLRTIHDEGLYAILRIGPYVCAEWNYGGFPVWLHNVPGITFRTKNQPFMDEMQNFTTLIVNKVKEANLFASQGGPIILAQIENEYGNVMSSYGNDGKDYINWCANLAQSYHIGIPWIMCQQSNAPESVIQACNGFYCDQYTPEKPKDPKIWTENWTGWYKDWGGQNPRRTAEDLAFSVARFFQYGGSLNNYYMYHGGTNFGRTSGGPYITTSYDYDAPLDEYGNPNQPKYGHLKQLHELILSAEKILTHGAARNVDYGNMMGVTVYTYKGQRFCFFGNANTNEDISVSFEGTNFTIPAWSVSLSRDCYTEEYNTARVTTQTTTMVKKDNEADGNAEPYDLVWTWKPEHFEHLKTHKKNKPLKGVTYANKLLDQKVATNDASDYLWYMTSVHVNENDPVWTKSVQLQVQTNGAVVHAFVNDKHIGSQWAKDGHFTFIFQKNIKLNPGNNSISLLSATVGLQNYGAFFDTSGNGINGPVKLVGKNGTEMNLGNNTWVYKVGMNGFDKGLYNDECHENRKWQSERLPINRMMIWYKTTFQSPLGVDPVVLDLMGLGKGIAWVNGNNIGRYWPKYVAGEQGCSYKCDYRGAYSGSKCQINCGQPTQRWYHVPREFLKDEGNSLVLFEELGGNPSMVKIQTVTVGKTCGTVSEYDTLNTLELSCQGGRVISEIVFASFGDPKGNCGSFEKGGCESPDSLSVVEKACLGKDKCSIKASEWTFEPSGCRAITKRLAVEALC